MEVQDREDQDQEWEDLVQEWEDLVLEWEDLVQEWVDLEDLREGPHLVAILEIQDLQGICLEVAEMILWEERNDLVLLIFEIF